MIVKCLGTAGYHPSPVRQTSCYYIPDLSLLLDAGTGLFRLTDELLASPRESIDIVLSHAHLDHTAGLTFLLDTMGVTSLKHVRVIGDLEKLDAIREHLYHSLIFPVPPAFEFVGLPKGKNHFLLRSARSEPACEIEWVDLDHPGGSLGYIIKYQGKQLAYITDTTATLNSPYVERLTDTDLLMHECNFTDDFKELAQKTGHSWLSGVTEIVEKSRPRKTLLIHHNPLGDTLKTPIRLEARHQKLNMHIAHDGDSVEF